jgi:hypothetical protein
MSDENKKQKRHKKNPQTEQTTAEAAAPEAPKQEANPPGERGEVGQATAGLTIKQRWHEAHFTRKDVGDKHNPRKRVWVRNHGAPSLKHYARDMAKSGDTVAKDWFAHKTGSLNTERTDANKTRISLEKQKTREAKRKKGQAKSSKAEAAPAATAGKK